MRLFKHDGPGQGEPRAAAGNAEPALDAIGEARDVTVMFADLEGFTAMAERLPPREVVAVLNQSFAVMAEEVFREHGIVDKYMGDAMLVLWTSDDGAEAAARAALRMVAAFAKLQVVRLEEGKRPLKLRIGMSSGEAILGEIGAPARRDKTVIGDPVNLACRLQELNKAYQTDILVSGATRERLSDRFAIRDLGVVPIKGRQGSIAIHELIAWHP